MIPPPLSPSELITYRHLGFENFDFVVLSVMIGRMAVAAVLGALVAYRPWRRLMHWRFEPDGELDVSREIERAGCM